jgi:alpha-aminoadipate/glutamate carrier protein LysW
MTASCPVCEARVDLSVEATAHELVDCAECSTELEIASLEPPSLREAPTEEEDWGE